MAHFTLDGSQIASREQFWTSYLDTVKPAQPELFGRNLDALHDALAGGPGWPGDNFVLCITASDELARRLGPKFVSDLQDVFARAPQAKLDLA